MRPRQHRRSSTRRHDDVRTENDLCYHKADVGNESPTIYSDDTVEDIASDGAFYNKSAGGDLTSIFSAIATDIGSGSSRLVDDGF